MIRLLTGRVSQLPVAPSPTNTHAVLQGTMSLGLTHTAPLVCHPYHTVSSTTAWSHEPKKNDYKHHSMDQSHGSCPQTAQQLHLPTPHTQISTELCANSRRHPAEHTSPTTCPLLQIHWMPLYLTRAHSSAAEQQATPDQHK